MKTGVRTEAKFIVKPENKVVVCKLDVDMHLADYQCWFMLRASMWKTKAPKVDEFGKFTVTAIAKCNPKDEFNESVGRRVAESRAKAKAFKTAKNVWKCISEVLTKEILGASNMESNCEMAERFEMKHVKKLTE